MKNRIVTLTIVALSLALLCSSCVSSSRLAASQAAVETLQKDSAKTHSKLKECDSQVKSLNDDKTNLQNDNLMALNELKTLSTTSKSTIAYQAKRLATLQTMMNKQQEVMTKLKDAIANALMNYKSDELYVYIKDGNVYVSLEEKLLFKSGSDVVDPKGKEALKTLSQVIDNTKDINVVIEGHTDSLAIKTIKFKDNWDLSTARATAIVRILTVDYGFDAHRITASGKSSFHPVKSNLTEEGRAANRRTEIILSPDLKELFELMYK
jgi:chemotaxis protein MotB